MKQICSRTLSSLVLAATAAAQCATTWQPGTAIPGVNEFVRACAYWDPDGPGPRTPLFVVGGDFANAGAVAASHIASFDPATGRWSALGAGLAGNVTCVAPLPNGDLLAGGSFVGNIARWNGTSWSTVGGGLNGSPSSILVLRNGDVVVAGAFSQAGGAPVTAIASWDGLAWHALGGGVANASALAELQNGHIVTAGLLSALAPTVSEWDGTSWSAVGSLSGSARALAVLPNGHLVAGGNSLSTPTVNSREAFEWDGATWTALGSGLGIVRALAVLSDGRLLAVGEQSGVMCRVWNGTTWTALGTGVDGPAGTLYGVATGPNLEAIVGGSLSIGSHVARFDGLNWSALGGSAVSFNQPVRALTILPGGDVVAGGDFTGHVARGNGAQWFPIGGGINGQVTAVAGLPNGDIIAGGTFTQAGSNAASNIARWDGTQWLPMGTGTDGPVLTLLAMPNGDVIAGGQFANAGGTAALLVARWNGTQWLPMGPGLLSFLGRVAKLALLPNGDVVACGLFGLSGSTSLGNIARWDGTNWLPIGPTNTFNNTVTALTVGNDGQIYAALTNIQGSRVSRWNGAAWVQLPSTFGGGAMYDLVPLPGGDILAGGTFFPATSPHVQRWDGSSWLPVDGGVPGLNDFVYALASNSNGDVYAGGTFATIGSVTANNVAQLRSNCPALATPYGSGCVGSAGPVTIVDYSPPWIGGPYHITATGFGSNSIAVWVAGTVTSMPLASVLPWPTAPGCTLLNLFEIEFNVQLPVAGRSTNTIMLPRTMAIVGNSGGKQVANVDLDANLDIVQVASSNGIQLTIGVF